MPQTTRSLSSRTGNHDLLDYQTPRHRPLLPLDLIEPRLLYVLNHLPHGTPTIMCAVCSVRIIMSRRQSLVSDAGMHARCRDVTDAMDPRERAEGHQIRGERYLAMAAPLVRHPTPPAKAMPSPILRIDTTASPRSKSLAEEGALAMPSPFLQLDTGRNTQANAGPEQDETYLKLIAVAVSSFDKASRAFSNLQDAAAKDKSLGMYLECKKGSDEAQARMSERYEIKEVKL